MKTMIYTIGHSNYTHEEFVEILRFHSIDTVIDIRGVPYSRHAPQFNKKNVKCMLNDSGIQYYWAGDTLGGLEEVSSSDREKGLRLILEHSKSKQVVIMCSERDFHRCHRHHIIARILFRMGESVIHIIGKDLRPVSESDFDTQGGLL